MGVTFEDFEIRYKNLREQYPELGNCTFEGCTNPRDITGLGVDTSCSYHRMLFDHWLYDVDTESAMNPNTKIRRKLFREWGEDW